VHVGGGLDVEAEVHDVAILDDILLTLDSHLPSLLDGGFTAVVDEVLKLDYLGTDEALLEVRVDSGCRTRCLASLCIRPGTYLLYACGEVGF